MAIMAHHGIALKSNGCCLCASRGCCEDPCAAAALQSPATLDVTGTVDSQAPPYFLEAWPAQINGAIVTASDACCMDLSGHCFLIRTRRRLDHLLLFVGL